MAIQPHMRRQSGSAVIEFTGALFGFVLMLIFILEGGALMVTQVAANNAAREGARAAVTLPPGDPHAAATRASTGFPERHISVSGGGDSVTVTVRLKTPFVFNIVDDWNWWVRGTATMRRER